MKALKLAEEIIEFLRSKKVLREDKSAALDIAKIALDSQPLNVD